MMKPSQRLYVASDLGQDRPVALDAGQAHYLAHVLRLPVGAAVLLFNGRDGEWLAHLTQIGKKGAEALCAEQARTQTSVCDLDLLFAPVKGDRTDTIVEKATELGVARIRPVLTERTIVRKLNLERLRSRAAEASEQCGTLFVPEVFDAVSLMSLLDPKAEQRLILFADEAGDAISVAEALSDKPARVALLTGPEGGFTPAEREKLRASPLVRPVNLGPRVLRADTATFAGLTLIQSAWGDWI
jgi:16S rRNA (uracil1498-N3)-methyltransferase